MSQQFGKNVPDVMDTEVFRANSAVGMIDLEHVGRHLVSPVSSCFQWNPQPLVACYERPWTRLVHVEGKSKKFWKNRGKAKPRLRFGLRKLVRKAG